MYNNLNLKIEFDGYCNFCSYWIRFIKNKDLKKELIYSNINNSDSIIVKIDEKIYYKSDAIIKILEYLNYRPILIKIIKYIPKLILDFLYIAISKYRYFIFGKRATCYNPLD